MTQRATDTRAVKALALEAGFDLVGVARAVALDPAPLDRWLAAGRHGSMAYLASGRDARVDPRVLLPSARSVIALAVGYWHPGDTALPDGGRISRYAWGRDYHKVVGRRVTALRRALADRFPGIETWGGTDAVPILEKVWAQRAGLGWVGKSGNLITQRYGTWVFLATLLTSLELEADRPAADRCGTCTACLAACPTGAIVAPREVDARRCLSYHTIEHREAWPEDVAARSEGWLFGCDVCQDVCPYDGRRVEPSTTADFAPRPAVMDRPLAGWIRLDAEAWDALTRGSPLRRPGREGLVRSALAAAAHAPPSEAVDAAVSERLEDGSQVVRLHALRAHAARRRRR